MKKTPLKARENAQTSALQTHQADIASKIAAAVTGAVSKNSKLTGSPKTSDGITVNIHVGDIYLIGFDEAIDAEEWGMRETNTEIIGGTAKGKKSTRSTNDDASADRNKVIERRIDFSKGGVKLVASENSKPAAKKRPANVATKLRSAVKKRATKKRPTAKK